MLARRRLLLIVGVALLILILSTSLLLSQGGGNAPAGGAPPPGYPGAGAPPGYPGAAGAPAAPSPAAAAGGQQMPPEVTMPYGEALQKDPTIGEVELPGEYKGLTLSLIEWQQLARIFRGRRAVALKPRMGRIGGRLQGPLETDIATRQDEMRIMKNLHEDAVENAFWFEVMMPKAIPEVSGPQAPAEVATVYVPVIMHADSQFPVRAVNQLKPYSGEGPNRQPFYLITPRGGLTRMHRLQLSGEAIGYWEQLWAGNTLEMNVYDNKGRRLISPLRQPAGHSGASVLDMVEQPRIHFASLDWQDDPAGPSGATAQATATTSASAYGGEGEGGYGGGPPTGGRPSSAGPTSGYGGDPGGGAGGALPYYTHWPKRRIWKKQNGEPLQIYGARGWPYQFVFTMPIRQIGQIDRVDVILTAEPAAAAGAAAGPGSAGGPGGYGGYPGTSGYSGMGGGMYGGPGAAAYGGGFVND